MRDALGRMVTVIDALGSVTSVVWSVEGDVLQLTTPDGRTREWVYDAERNLIRHVDALGHITTTEYTHFDLPAARTLADGSRTVFGYDTELRLTAVTNALGDVWSYTYDPAGHLIAETDGAGRTLTYRHDHAGRLAEQTNATGQTLTYQRDIMGRVVAELTAEGTTRYAYDLMGRMTSAVNPDASLQIVRDVRGRIIGEAVDGRALTLELDALGRCVTRTTPSGDVTAWTYGPTGLPGTLATGGHLLTFGHDAVGRETSRVLDTGVTITSDWDVTGRLVERSVRAAGHEAARDQRLVNRRRWTYRADGSPVAIDDHRAGLTSFELDALGRVVSAETPHGAETYAYDGNGNPVAAAWPHRESPDSDVSAALGDRTLTAGRIVRSGRVTFTYDAQGRMVTRKVRTLSGQSREWRYAWSAHDRLVGVVGPDGVTWRYRYDALGRRTAKQRLDDAGGIAAEVTFTWHGPVLVEQAVFGTVHGAAPVSTTTWTHLPGTWRPVTQHHRTQAVKASRFHLVDTDLVGTPTDLVTPTGSVAWSRQATTYDVPLSGEGRVTCPLRFPGQYFDPETGQNHNYHRIFDPTLATYTSADPLGLGPGPNPRTYVTNPATWTDPLGLIDYAGVGNNVGRLEDAVGNENLYFHYTDAAGHAGFESSGNIVQGMKGRVHVTQEMYSASETHNALYIGAPGYEARGDYVIAMALPEGTPLVPGSMPNELFHEGTIRVSPDMLIYHGPNPF